MSGRPAVSVVVPFAGGSSQAQELAIALGLLRLKQGDELIVGDNSRRGVASEALAGGVGEGGAAVRIVRAADEASSYHARNTAARVASCDWILFIDSDCVPHAGLLDAYFAAPVGDDVGALAGPILHAPDQRSLAARYAQARNFVVIPEAPGAIPTAPTGNLLVRREVFDRVGGFVEGIRSGGDVDFCRRIQEARSTLELRPSATVAHPHSESLRGYLAIVARYAAGARWLDARYPGIAPRWPLWPELWRAVRDATRLWARGDLDEAAFRLLDGASLVAHNVGYRRDNLAGRF